MKNSVCFVVLGVLGVYGVGTITLLLIFLVNKIALNYCIPFTGISFFK